MKFIFPLSVLLFVFSSCGSYSDSEKSQADLQIKALIQKKGWKMEKSESGVYQQLVEEGKGNEIHLRDILVVSYTGYLINGTVFDKTKKPIELDMTAVIAGWKEVLVGKKVGSKVRFICPPHMAYGRSSKGPIPENSILIFEVFVEGTKYKRPSLGTAVYENIPKRDYSPFSIFSFNSANASISPSVDFSDV